MKSRSGAIEEKIHREQDGVRKKQETWRAVKSG